MKTNQLIVWSCAAILAGGLCLEPAHARGEGDGHKYKGDRAAAKADHPDKGDRADKAAAREKTRGENADKREAKQARRIENGVKRGALTQDELDTLTKQQKQIEDFESSIKGDGKVTRDEAKDLKDMLNTASRNIWGQKHDTEGNQMAVYRLGQNVFAKDELTSKMSDPNLSKEEARKFAKDFKTMTSLKKSLAGDDLTPEQRSKAQAKYNELLNQYFEVRSK